MASEVVAYVAVSLDGYIAAEGGSVDFLHEYASEEYNFHGFFDTLGALVMGSTTYEQVLERGWPYGDIPCLVLTSRELEVVEEAEITFSSAKTADAIKDFAAITYKRIWVVGGGSVITSGIKQGAIDTLELYVMPVALGSGVSLFTESYDEPLNLVDSAAFSNGVVRLVYSTS